MRWLARVFASAVARRFAYVIVAFLFAALGVDNARAQDVPPCTVTSSPLCSQGQAYSLAAADASADRYCTSVGSWSMLSYQVYLDGVNRYGVEVRCRRKEDGFETGARNSRRWVFDPSKTCQAIPSAITQFLPLNGSSQCWNGCEVKYRQNGDDETSTRSPTGALCDPDYKKKLPCRYVLEWLHGCVSAHRAKLPRRSGEARRCMQA